MFRFYWRRRCGIRAKTKREAIVTAIEDFNRRKRMAELIKCGISAGAGDLLIAACARHHAVELEHADADFDHLARV